MFTRQVRKQLAQIMKSLLCTEHAEFGECYILQITEVLSWLWVQALASPHTQKSNNNKTKQNKQKTAAVTCSVDC
jgi:hypothetical protein